MNYDAQILDILAKVGEQGIAVSMLAKHVYNVNSTLFASPDLQEVHQYVQQYLLKNSKNSQSLIERTEKRGWYRLNTRNSAYARQLMLEFEDAWQEDTEAAEDASQSNGDLSLNLFDDSMF